MLDSIFMQVLDMGNTASIVILVVLLARLLLKKVPKVFSYALWAVVLFRLLCPFTFEATVSIMPEMASVSQDYSLSEAPISVLGAAEAAYHAVGDALNGGLGVQDIRTTEKDEEGRTKYVGSLWWDVWILFGQYVWVAGMGVMLLYSTVSYLKIRKKLLVVVPLRDNIFLADDINSPFVVGLFRPKIYLPCNLEEKEQEYIILHEQYHIKRLDHVVKALAFLALAIHWFNPLVWVAFILASKDMEMSCDEAVVKKMGDDVRADYSASLLTLATGRRIIAGTPLAFGEGDTKSRIRNLANWRKPAFWVIAVSVIACVVVSVCFLTNPPRDPWELPKWLENDEAVLEYILEYVEVDGKKVINGTYLETGATLGSGGYKKFRVITSDGRAYILKANGRYYRDALITGHYGPGLRVTDITCDSVIGSRGGAGVISYSTHERNEFEPSVTTNANTSEYDSESSRTMLGPYLFDLPLYGHMNAKDGFAKHYAAGTTVRISGEWRGDYPLSFVFSGEYTNEDVITVVYSGTSKTITLPTDDTWTCSVTSNGGRTDGDFWLYVTDPTVTSFEIANAYDMNHNGTLESYKITWGPDAIAGSGDWKLSFIEDGVEIWYDFAGLTHAGWNSIFAVKVDGKDYLLRYNPDMGTGIAWYRYKLFSLGEDGEEVLLKSNEIEFDVNFGGAHQSFDPAAIAAFLQEVHSMLNEESELLLSTEGAAYRSGGCGAGFDGDAFWGDSFDDSEKTLEENLRLYAEEMSKVQR